MEPIFVLTRWGDRAMWRFDSQSEAETAMSTILRDGDDVSLMKLSAWPVGAGQCIAEGKWPTLTWLHASSA